MHIACRIDRSSQAIPQQSVSTGAAAGQCSASKRGSNQRCFLIAN